MQAYCHLVLIHGSGAGSLKLEIYGEAPIVTMTEPLDADVLKDLRGLGKPPSFDGNDTDYRDFRFCFRIHMSLVSAVSHALMDKCEVERNSIILAGVKALVQARTDVLLVGFDREWKCPNC